MEGTEIVYVHRGAPGGTRCVCAADVGLEKSFFVLENHKETRVPYHRIVEVKKEREVIWKKR